LLSLDTDDTEIAANYLESDMEYADNTDGTGATVIEQETPGEAVFTSASGVSTIAGAKLLKEQTKAQNKASLMEIINNEELTEEAKKEAVNSMITLTENTQKESDAQMLLEAKGFTQAVVSISGDTVDVMVAASTLTTAETAQIIDIVQRKTEIAPENIIITISKSE
jgi:stage III sporulation protein AH